MEFFSFIIMIVLAIVANYANDEADIGEEEYMTFNPTAKHLFEKENIHYYDVDTYIQEHIIPSYQHSTLYYRIKNYQNKEEGCLPLIIIIGLLSGLNAFAFIRNDLLSPLPAFLISLGINIVLYFFVTLLYHHTPIFKKIKLKNYSDVCNVYYVGYHYKYLKSIEESVMFRYFFRKILSGIAMIICLLNIWSTDI